MSPWGRKEILRPIWKPAPPRPRMPESMIWARTSSGDMRQRLAQHLVAAAALVHVQRVQPRLVDAVEEDRLHVSLWSWGDLERRARPGRSAAWSASVRPAVSARCGWSGSENSWRRCPRWGPPSGGSAAACREDRRPASRSSTIRSASASSSGPTYSPLTDAIGAMSQAPRHSNERTSMSWPSAAAGHRVVELVGAEDRAARCSCTRTRRWRAWGCELEHVVEARHRGQVGGGEAHDRGHLVDRLRRAPAVHRLGGVQRRDRRRAAVGVLGHRRLDLARAVLRDRRRAGSGTTAGSLVRSTASSQPGTREPWPKRGTERESRPLAAREPVGSRGAIRSSSVDPAQDRVEHRQRRDQVGDVGVARPSARSAWRLTKLGSRMCTRAGLAEPSARTKQPSSPRGPSIG